MEKKKFLNDFREAAAKTEGLSDEIMVDIVLQLLEDPDKKIDIKGADAFISFAREKVKAGDVPLNWLTKLGPEKVSKVDVPGAVIISAELKLDPDVLKFLRGTKFIRGNRMLIFHNDKMVFADVSRCQPKKLAEQYNNKAIEAMQKNLYARKLSTDPVKPLNSLIDQAMGLSFDSDETVHTEDQDDRPNPFREWLNEIQSEDND